MGPALAAAFDFWGKTGNSSSSGRTGLRCYNHLLRIFCVPGSGPRFCFPGMCYMMGKTHESNVMHDLCPCRGVQSRAIQRDFLEEVMLKLKR